MIVGTAAAALPLLAVWAGVRSVQRVRTEQEFRARHSRGPDGIIAGAEPIRLVGDAGAPSVLLLHGFGDTPQSLRRLAAHLHASLHWTVHAPLLPGHGRDLRAFARSDARAWMEAARASLRELQRTAPPVALVGQSMGGALAVRLAAERADVPALVLLAPYLGMMPRVEQLARRHRLVSLVTAYVRSQADGSIRDPAERAGSLGYGVTTPRLLHELHSVVSEAWEALPQVQAPTLVMQSREDNRIRPEDAARLVAWLAGPEAGWVTGQVINSEGGFVRE